MEDDREGLKAAVGPQLFEDVLNMISRGHRADTECGRNSLGGFPPRPAIARLFFPVY